MNRESLPVAPAHVPPGCVVDVDVYALDGAEQDAHRAWLKLQRSGYPDLIWTPRNGGHWIALKGDKVHDLIGDSQRLSSRTNVVPRELSEGSDYIPIQLDPPEHTPYRMALMRGLSPKVLMSLQEPVRDLAKSLVAEVYDRGECEFMSEVAEILPTTVFLTLVGIPVEDRRYLRGFVEQLNRPDGTMTGAQVMAKITEYLTPIADARMANPGDDLFSHVLAEPINGRPWTRDEAVRMCRNLLVGGLDTVVAMLGFTAHFLACNPQRQAELRDDPKLCVPAADEFIRRFAPVQLVREVVVDHMIDDIPLRCGDIILLPTMLHNLDDRSFDRPLDIDFQRGPVRHSTLGTGPHRCAGAGLARMEVATFLHEWTSGIGEFRLAAGADIPMQPGGVATIKKLPLCWTKPGRA